MKTFVMSFVVFFCVVGLFLGTAASGWAAVDTASDPSFLPASVGRLAVLVLGQKVWSVSHPSRRERYSGPTTGALDNDQQNFQRFVEDEFITALMKKHYSVVARSDLETIQKEKHLQLNLETENDAITCGKILNVPAVMVVSVTEYKIEENPRSAARGRQPPRITFQVTTAMDARLLSVVNGKLLWSGKYRTSPTVPDRSSASAAVAHVASSIAKAFPERTSASEHEPEQPKPVVENKPVENKPPTFTFEGKYTWSNGKMIEFLPGGKVKKSWKGMDAEWLSLGESKYKILSKEKDKHHHEHIKSVDFVTLMPDGSLSVSNEEGRATVTWTALRTK